MHFPDYDKSILNLMVSLERAFSKAKQPLVYQTLEDLPVEEIRGRNVILLVLDGLGDDFLKARQNSFLYELRRSSLTSVFPTSTAPAITTFHTAVAPALHGITGWFEYFHELGSVAISLPFRPRWGGASFGTRRVRPADLLGSPSLFERIKASSLYVVPEEIADSDFTKAASKGAERISYRSLDDLLRILENPPDEFDLIFAYWSEFDTIAHRAGVGSPDAEAHFRMLDTFVEQLSQSVLKRGDLLVVTADHGLVDVVPEDELDLRDHPDLAELLALPLCGEPRAPFLYARAGREGMLEKYVTEKLADHCELRRSTELLGEGIFGPGKRHPSIERRIGDYILLMKGHRILRDHVMGETLHPQIGVHGGLTSGELNVPLCILS